MHAGYEKSTEVGISLFQRKSSSYISTPRDNPYAGSTLWVRQVPDQLTVVPSSVLPVVSEEGESEASCSSGTSILEVLCEGTARVCAISEEASCKSGVHGIVHTTAEYSSNCVRSYCCRSFHTGYREPVQRDQHGSFKQT